ncbi:MAG: patatin-like phospholipase family protein [Candidatus Krumholzibacteriota bacterium]|nr:patatin-like phospholipase family protein [Candidatus Krumholzibacteriota bacterium]
MTRRCRRLSAALAAWICLAAAASSRPAPANAAPSASPEPDAAAGGAAARPRVGLVLSGGGARGLAHLGVLAALDSLEIPVDCVAGTSFGGLAGALYAAGYRGREIETLARVTDWRDLFTDLPARRELPFAQKAVSGRYQTRLAARGWRVTAPSGLIIGQKIGLFFSRLTFPWYGLRDFDDLCLPYRCVATDIVTGEEVVVGRGSLPLAMSATMAVPSIFSPVEWEGRLLVDGGLVNNLPVDVARELGADIVIAVDVESPLLDREQLLDVFDMLAQTTAMLGRERKARNLADADLVIRPALTGLSTLDFEPERVEELLRLGNEAARAALPELLALRERLRASGGGAPGVPRDAEAAGEAVAFAGAPARRVPPAVLPRLGALHVEGNDRQPRFLVDKLLAYQPGDLLEPGDIERRIMALYGLGYFESIRYRLEPAADGRADLVLTVKELPSRLVHVGLRYDDRREFVAALGGLVTNRGLPGLRLEGEIQFGGLLRCRGVAHWLSRTLDFPAYPIFEIRYRDVRADVYDAGGELYSRFKDRGVTGGAGFGVQAGKCCNLRAEFQIERLDAAPDKSELYVAELPRDGTTVNRVEAELIIDTLDDVQLPADGACLWARWSGAYADLGSERDYRLTEMAADLWRSFGRHTAGLHAYRAEGAGDLPYCTAPRRGALEGFHGVEYDQLAGRRLHILGASYRLRVTRWLYLSGDANLAFDLDLGAPEAPVESPDRVWGGALGAIVPTPLGPLELSFGYGRWEYAGGTRDQTPVSFRFGARF